MDTQRILVTGGAGYIGSHCVVELLAHGHDVAVIDNLSNSSARSLERVSEIAGRSVPLFRSDLLDTVAVRELLVTRPFDAVIHFAGLKAVGESLEQPLRYYHNNVSGTISLLEAMQAVGLKRLVFSSSCTVYGTPEQLPITEEMARNGENPYARTKMMIEDILGSLAESDPEWRIANLRYFNPVGAHQSGVIGEDPRGRPNNLMPFLMQVAAGRYDHLRVFGNDYPTPDGTCIRDYVHVCDLATAHLAALEALESIDGFDAFNLGTGTGHSVLDVIRAAEQAVGRPIPYEIAPRRQGDAAASYANPAKAERQLGWAATRQLPEMCGDHWRWQRDHPHGYD